MKKLPIFLFIGAIGLAIYLFVYMDGGNVKIKTGENSRPETKNEIKRTPEVKRAKKVHEFNKIKVEGHFEVFVTYGAKEKVEIEASDKSRKEIKLKVESGTLLVKIDRNTALLYRPGSKIHVYTEKLNDFELGGTASVKLNNTLKDNSFSIKSGGAASFKGDVDVTEAEIELGGASSMELSGGAASTRLDLSGASKFGNSNFKVKDLTVDMNGLSKAKITCLKSLEGEITGISKLTYTGSPSVKNVKTSGSASLQEK